MSTTIKLIVSTHQGKLFDEICNYVLIKSKNGDFGVLPNHVPVITTVEDGFVKFVLDGKELYLCVYNSIIEFNNNVMSILAQEAYIGDTMESAIAHLEEVRKERLERNRQTDTDLATLEHELVDNIKKVKAGYL